MAQIMTQTAQDAQGEAPEERRKLSSLADARLLILEKNGLPIPESDPIMMLVVLLLALADDYDTLLARHNRAVTSTMKGIIGEARQGMEQEVQRFADQVKASTLENVVLLIAQHQRQMAEHQQSVKLLTWVCMGLSVLVPTVMVAVMAWRLA